MRKVLITVCLLIGLGFSFYTTAQEWSDPIQLTDTEGLWMSYTLCAFVDSDNILHVTYGLENYGDPSDEVFYQKFTRYGEKLMEPIPVSYVSELPDSSATLLTAYLDPDGIFHIIWASYWGAHYYTSFKEEAEVVHGGIYLPEGASVMSTIKRRIKSG